MGRTNRQGIELIRGTETCELEAYPDPGSALHKACEHAGINPLRGGYRRLSGWEQYRGDPWTIGFGDTGPDVVPGLVITEDEAESRFVAKIDYFEGRVSELLEVEATGNQFSALVSFGYNAGCGPKGLGGSALLRKFNAGDVQGAAGQFPRWNRSGGRVMPGLVTRRAAERELFLTPGDGDPA